MSLFLCLLGILLGQYCQKNVAIGEGFRKKYIKGDDHIGGCLYKWGSNLLHTMIRSKIWRQSLIFEYQIIEKDAYFGF